MSELSAPAPARRLTRRLQQRDAVRDDAPLGPSDDQLFETPPQSGGGLFKRKR